MMRNTAILTVAAGRALGLNVREGLGVVPRRAQPPGLVVVDLAEERGLVAVAVKRREDGVDVEEVGRVEPLAPGPPVRPQIVVCRCQGMLSRAVEIGFMGWQKKQSRNNHVVGG